MPLEQLSKPDLLHSRDNSTVVDIIAVHGLYESSLETWTDKETSILWLRDLYPHRLHKSRILLHSFKADTLTGAESLVPHATTMIAELCAQRSEPGAQQRPIIFICHGIGGLLVKSALALSRSKTMPRVEHLRSIYLSTYAILFMGTPHHGIKKEGLLLPESKDEPGPSQFMLNLLEGSDMINEMTKAFAPILDELYIFNFWEQMKSSFGSVSAYIVEESSAAPVAWDSAERCGMMSTHSNMVKMDNAKDNKYQLLRDALERYTKDAPGHIQTRWLAKGPSHESKILETGIRRQPTLNDLPTNDSFTTDLNKWFIVERSPTTYFTGREAHAKDVKNRFSEAQRQGGRKSHATFVIYGLGGSGKTQFCLKYAHDNRSRYWGVFWIDASTSENAEASFAKIDGYVRNGANHSKSASFSATMHWLLQTKKPWLLILDNADDLDMDVPRYIPAGSHGHILITTRNPNVIEYATVGHVRFSGMDPEEAISLLLKTATPADQNSQPDPGTRTLAQAIASELGYLALPLVQAGATIRRRIYSLERYLHHYLGHRKTMMSYPQIQGANDANIITTWEIPFQRITEKPSAEHKDAVILLHIFAFMHFESIPEGVFQRAWSEVEQSWIELEGVPDLLHPNRDGDFKARIRSAIRVLSDYSIVEYEPNTRTCGLHPVIHGWARERLDDAEQRKWLSTTISVLSLSISPNFEASGRKFRQLLIPHMDLCLETLVKQFPSYPETLDRAAEIEKFAIVYAENGLWEKARDLQIKVLDFRRKYLGRWHDATLKARRHLGFTYWNMFAMEPLIWLQFWTLVTLWFIRPSIMHWFNWTPWFPDHIPYCLAMDDLAQSLWLVGQRERSQHVGQRAVAGLKKRLGQEDPKTLNAMFNLARTNLHLGNHQESKSMLLYVLKLRKRFFGLDHVDTLMVRNELGILLCAEKRNLHVAERLIANVFEARKRVLGDEHAYTLWSVNDLSKAVCECGRPAEAVDMLRKIIPVVTRTLGAKHVGLSMTKGNLARALALCEEWALAEELLVPLLQTIRPDHPDWVHTKYGLARVQARLGKREAVEEACLEMLDQISKSKMIALDSARTIAIAEELLKVYIFQNRLLDVIALKKRVPALNEENFIGDKFDVHAVRKGSQPSIKRHRTIPEPTGHCSPLKPYCYSPLPSSFSFRVLELLPGRTGDELSCRLHIEEWTKKTNFEALSYAWGDPTIKIPIKCDGQRLEITSNLCAGLVELRQQDTSRFLWADAICVDQKNLVERGQQVSVMRQIYKSATQVIVWLGQDEYGQAVDAVQFIEHIADVLCKEMPGKARAMSSIDDLYEWTNNDCLVSQNGSWLAVAWYFSRPWFQRLWVFQEVNCGPDIVVICGSTCTSWDAVGLTATYIKRWQSLRDVIAHVDNTFWYNAYIMRSRHQQSTISAASMLSQGQNFVTTDPLDRIYALLGTLPLRSWENDLKPDYTRSRRSLYLEVARRCLLNDKDGFFLSHVQHNDGVDIENFPSWVPQWDQQRIRVPIAIPKANWATCATSQFSAAIEGDDHSTLKLRGLFFDTIMSKFDIDPDQLFNSETESSDQEHPLLTLWRTQRTPSNMYLSKETVIEAFAATFALGYRITFASHYWDRLIPDFLAYMSRLTKSSLQQFPDLQLNTDDPSGDWKNYINVAHSMSYRRCFFVTSKGYMGLGPNAMQIGDIVCVLFGCKVPFILRPMGGYYLLVGDSYIHGIMDGEAMAAVLKERTFVIH